jgi:hypothetical protein
LDGIVKASDCRGLTEHPAGERLKKIASEIPGDLAIVEIGVYTGRSLLYMAEGSMEGNGAPVHGIDPWDLPRPSKAKYSDPEVYRYVLNAVSGNEAGFLIQLHKDFSSNVAKKWRGPKVGLLYVDSDHRYGPVLKDFADWEPHFADGAVLCWDDYHFSFPGVVKAVDELYANGRIRDLHMPEHCSRLAVARWNG